jgi:hypothetical protein
LNYNDRTFNVTSIAGDMSPSKIYLSVYHIIRTGASARNRPRQALLPASQHECCGLSTRKNPQPPAFSSSCGSDDIDDRLYQWTGGVAFIQLRITTSSRARSCGSVAVKAGPGTRSSNAYLNTVQRVPVTLYCKIH